MVTSELSSEKVERKETNSNSGGTPGSGLRKEPSFSGWVDEDGQIHLEHELKNPDGTTDDSDFELPLPHHSESEKGFSEGHSYSKFPEGSVHLNSGGSNMDESSLHHRTDASEKFVPFDVDHVSPSPRNTRSPKSVVGGPGTTGKRATLPSDSRSSLSAADVSKTLILILVWYTFSTFLTLYNKTLLGDDLGKFPAPLLMNTVHFAMQALLAKVITWYWSQRFQPTVPMSWKDYFSRGKSSCMPFCAFLSCASDVSRSTLTLTVVPTALSTALDVDLSNESLVFISVTFATMCKSAAPIFLLLFAFAFRLETPSFKLLGIIVVISFGILLTVAKETEFDFWGFIFVILAAVMSGFRWCMTQILLQKDAYGLKNPLAFMSCVTPVMAVATAVLSLILDPWPEFSKNNYFNSSWNVAQSCFLMLFGGTLAFFMVLTEYVLISVTSAVTVTIAGVVKEAVTILVAVSYFHDEFTWLKGAGLLTIMVGVSLFNWYKYQKLHKEHVDADDFAVSSSTEHAAKYVILEEMDDQDDVL